MENVHASIIHVPLPYNLLSPWYTHQLCTSHNLVLILHPVVTMVWHIALPPPGAARADIEQVAPFDLCTDQLGMLPAGSRVTSRQSCLQPAVVSPAGSSVTSRESCHQPPVVSPTGSNVTSRQSCHQPRQWCQQSAVVSSAGIVEVSNEDYRI